MRRLWWRLFACLVLLPVLAVMSLPFSERGSRLILETAARLLPLEIEYGGGTLAGVLELGVLAWGDEDLRLELRGTALELAPGCLWHSKICFRQLYARQLDLTVLPGPAAPSPPLEADTDESLFEFPVPLEAANLQLAAVRVRWQGGEWRQGPIDGAVRITGSTIVVDRAVVRDARLELTDSGDDGGAFTPPRVHLPLELLVRDLVVQRAAWNLYGSTGLIDSLRLTGGEWLATRLRLGQMQVDSTGLGHWQAAAVIEFSSQWPLTLDGRVRLPPMEGWPDSLGRDVNIILGGDLAALAVKASSAGELALSADGLLDTLDPVVPFQLAVSANWTGELALAELLAVPDSLATVAFTAPLQLDASGSLDEQVFQLETTVGGLGYEPLALRMAGNHAAGRVALEDFRLADGQGANSLWARGELEYSGEMQWSALLESSGFDLRPLAEYGAGRVQGQLQLLGTMSGDEWTVSLLGADIDGTLDDLPVRLSGYAGIDSQLQLQASELQAQINGTTVLLRTSPDRAQPARLDITLDDLGRWQAGSRGSLSLQVAAAPGWEVFSVTGSARDIRWQDLRIGGGRITGKYHRGEHTDIDFELTLDDLAAARMELERTRLSARGDGDALVVTLFTRGDIDGSLELSGRLGSGGTWSGFLAPATLQTGQGNLYLEESVAVEFSPSPATLRLAAHCWQFAQSRLCPGEALLGERGFASLAVQGNLASLAAILPADLEVKGLLTAQLAAAWEPGRPVTVDGEASAGEIVFTRHFGGGEAGVLVWEKMAASVHNGAAGLALAAGIYSGETRVLDLDLHLPPDRGEALSGTLDIAALQLATLAPMAPTMSILAGELRGQLRVHGTLDRPLAEGGMQLSGGHFAVLGNPTELQQLELQMDVRGDRAKVQGRGSLGGGALGVEGTVSSRPEWRLELAIKGDHHELLLPPYTQMLVSEQLDLIITGGLLDLDGDIVVHEGSLEHEQLPAGGVTLSDDVVEVDLTGNVIYEPVPFDISLNLGLLVEDNFRILGDMVNATVGGDLQLRQEPRQPLQVFGNLNVIGGELRAYQQHLRIQRGTVSFAGTPDNPELDVRAQREISANNVVVGLQLQGTLNQPRLEVFSDPVMAHGETMSYLVRGRGLDSGAGADGMAMALSMGSGLVNQSALVTELNRIPGISNISFGAEGSTESDTAATVGGYIGERLYLSYGMGIYEPINVLTARLYLQTRLWLEVVSRLENSVDLYYSFDID